LKEYSVDLEDEEYELKYLNEEYELKYLNAVNPDKIEVLNLHNFSK
jgi:hypothetical protein